MTDETINPSSHGRKKEKEVETTQGALVAEKTLSEFAAAASVEKVYGKPIKNGDTVIIPAAEIFQALGMGFGSGEGASSEGEGQQPVEGSGSGGGWGGAVRSRPVAVIVLTPNSVRIEPIIDRTALGLAAISTFAFMLGTLFRLFRPARRFR